MAAGSIELSSHSLCGGLRGGECNAMGIGLTSAAERASPTPKWKLPKLLAAADRGGLAARILVEGDRAMRLWSYRSRRFDRLLACEMDAY